MTGKRNNLLLLEEHYAHLEEGRAGEARVFRKEGRELFRLEDSGTLRLPAGTEACDDLLRSFPYRVDRGPEGPTIPLRDVREMDRVYALIESTETRLREASDAGAVYSVPRRRLRLPSSRFLKGILLFSAVLLLASFLILSYALSRESVVSDRALSVERLLGR